MTPTAHARKVKDMVIKPKERNIAYRCPECGGAVLGLVGRFALKANMLRLKCVCEDADALDISIASDKKIRLSVPCLFCKQHHNYVITESIFFDREHFLLNCPYTGMDIAFIGDKKTSDEDLARTGEEIERLLASFEAEELADIQPQDMNEDEILPDPTVYDALRFVVKDLEAEGKVYCPCQGEGDYDLRFTDEGMQVYCKRCGASRDFPALSPSLSEEYISIDEIRLK